MSDMSRAEELAQRLDACRRRLREAERAAGRAEGSVRLLPVTKFHPAEDVALLAELGIDEVGENREQEARVKAAELPHVRFAMIGQIQTKKANAVARWAAACHSVDSLRLAEGLERGTKLALDRGDRTSRVLDCYVQLSYDGDDCRGGAESGEVEAIVGAIESAEYLLLRGFMVVPPLGVEAVRVFADARERVDLFSARVGRYLELSAGMSGDMEEAVAAGSDVVRVGTAILGARQVA